MTGQRIGSRGLFSGMAQRGEVFAGGDGPRPGEREMKKMKLSAKMSAVAVALCLACAQGARADATLGMTCADDPDPARVGAELTYRLAVTNSGPDAALNTILTDVLPPGAEFVSCSPSLGTWSNDSGTIYCNLGNLANGATAAVTLVCTPNTLGTATNQSSLTADNASSARINTETTVIPANRSPAIAVPGPHTVLLGSVTSFVVSVSDPDHDPDLGLESPVKPAGATFDGTNFTWTAAAAFFNTTNWIGFVADDHQGETNSVVTNGTWLVVPYDGDADAMDDQWEWNNFQTLTNAPAGDRDGDGQDNGAEYLAGSQPTNAVSAFRLLEARTPAAGTNHLVRVATEPGRRYTIYYLDDDLRGAQAWSPFANPEHGVWTETAPSSTNHVFSDNEGPDTTGGPPATGRRYYKVKVERP